LKFAAFKLKNDPQRVRVGQVSDDLSQIEEFSIDTDLSEQGVVGIFKAGHESLKRAAKHSISDVILCAPVPRPRRNIFCVGKNYFEHAKEFSGSGFDSSMTKPGDDIPQDPIIFTKVPESVVATGSQVLIPKNVSTAIDYEAELAVIIGRQAKGVSEADAMQYVWGYTIVNDVTSRDWQSRHKQWHMGKSFDTFCPMGPWVVTADECDGQSVDVKCYVNGELRQNSNSKDLIFNIPKLIATLSAGITLYPGDIIATGTPVGVGIGFKPPKYLVDGDVVKVEIEKIGFIENTFKAI
jgi:2-keto-4-pentenoate hydratase/2-oxohepta-3-ene-1,7-dioic acid hydratase in catechol pathway